MAVFANNYKLYTLQVRDAVAFVVPDNSVWVRVYVFSGNVTITGANGVVINLPTGIPFEWGNMASRSPKLSSFNIQATGAGIVYNIEYLTQT
jgi:hypothetical protein